MIDPSTLRWINTAARAWKTAGTNEADALRNRWISAAGSTKVYKKYNGAARQYADSLGVDEDTIGHLYWAWQMYQYVKQADVRRAREIRKRSPYTRFLALHEAFIKYEFSPREALDFLEVEGGAGAMKGFIENALHPLPEWHRRAIYVSKPIAKLCDDLDVPDALREWAREGRELLNDLLEAE